jgi:hypothetical protein
MPMQFPAVNPALLQKRLDLITQVLIEVFENYPVVVVAFGVAKATQLLEAGEDVPSAIDVGVQAIADWLRSAGGLHPAGGSLRDGGSSCAGGWV